MDKWPSNPTEEDFEWLKKRLEVLGENAMSVEDFLTLTAENASREEVKLLRMYNFPKPPNMVHSFWNLPMSDELSPRVRKVINLLALGRSPAMVAAEIGMTVDRVYKITALPEVKLKVAHKQQQLFENDAKQYMKTLMNKAYAVIDDILDDVDEKSAIRLEASKFVIDHVVGKANQVVEHKGNLLVEFINKLDAQSREVEEATNRAKVLGESKVVDVEANEVLDIASEVATASKVLAPMKDAMDTIVDSILGDKKLVIGDRSK
jgi:hypothetical protein